MLLADDANLIGWEVDARVSAAAARRIGLLGAMAAMAAAVAALAYWDERRESAAALQDLAEEQATLAGALGVAMRLGAEGAPAANTGLDGLRSIERPGVLAIVARREGEAAWRTTAGRALSAPRLDAALGGGQSIVRIPREESAAFGLPARTALAGLARVDAGAAGRWQVAAVAGAERERDREDRARRRLVLSVATAVGLVLALGGVVMRIQRKELVLERELAVSALQRNRDERLARASKAAVMGTLAMGVAHEISTPLGVIAVRAEQIQPRVAGDERLAGSVAAILSQTDRISQIIRGLLGLARGDAPSAQRIDPRDVVEGAVGLVEHRFAKAGVRLSRRSEPGVRAVVGDPRLLEHAVVNLLLNACEACKPGGDVEITLGHAAVGVGDSAGVDVEIAVEDSGAGISPDDVGRALEPFFTTKAREGGTGLGLAIAHEIVASHRGRLVFSAAPSGGTRAAIRLPPEPGLTSDGTGHAEEPARG